MEIKLTNGQLVKIAEKFTVGQIKFLKKNNLIPKNYIQLILNGSSDISQMSIDEFDSLTYAAYVVANPVNPMDQEQFENLLPIDIERDFAILGSMIEQEKEESVMADEFKKVTNIKKKRTRGKYHR